MKTTIILKKAESSAAERILKQLAPDAEVEFVTYGFSPDADFYASDQIEADEGINFKLNYKGSSVPIWLKAHGEKTIETALPAICAAIISGMNIVEVSEALKK